MKCKVKLKLKDISGSSIGDTRYALYLTYKLQGDLFYTKIEVAKSVREFSNNPFTLCKRDVYDHHFIIKELNKYSATGGKELMKKLIIEDIEKNMTTTVGDTVIPRLRKQIKELSFEFDIKEDKI